MKKRYIIIFIVLFLLLVALFVLKSIPYGTMTYEMPNSNVKLEVPKFSSFEKECCMFSATFKSFRSKLSLQKELDTIINNYEKKTCNNKTIYYDKNHNITITEYGVKYGIIMNTFYITYDKGKYDNNDCNVVTDPIKLTYQIDYNLKNKHESCYIPEQFKYLNKDGKMYNVYYECFGDLLFQTGMGKMNYLNSMIFYSWISMDDIMTFLEYQVKNNNATKETYNNENSILYKNEDFSLLKCDTINGNKDIYIGNTDFEYKENYCK